MKFLVDECLLPLVADLLAEIGHDAVHLRDLSLLGATDSEVMAAARDHGRVVVSADTDFGELLAKSGDDLPSVILLRRNHNAASQASAILAALPDVIADLAVGAVVVNYP